MNSFVKLSHYAGMREDLIQAGGGNSSYKESDNKMFIKASGYQLSDVTESVGYAVVNPAVIKAAFIETYDLNSVTEIESKQILNDAFLGGEKPSIETFLHAISGKYTLHTHPVVVNILACRKNGLIEIERLFPDTIMVPYATPGVELAKAFFKIYMRLNDQKKSGIVFLQNHGLMVSGDSASEVISETERITKTIETALGIKSMEAYHSLTKLWNHFKDMILWKVTDINVLQVYEANGIWNHTFCPDCVVFLGKKMLMLEIGYSRDDIDQFTKMYGTPVVIEYEGSLYIRAESVKKALEIQSVLSFSAQVMKYNKNSECIFLSDEEQNFLMRWDEEKYRRNLK